MNKLYIYTLQNCLICNELKGKLKELHIPYQETIIDDGNKINSKIGDNLERIYKTTTYPILRHDGKDILTFITKTELNESRERFIYEDVNQIINKLKQYEI